MIRNIFTIFLIFAVFSLFGQDIDTVYINNEVRFIEGNKTLNQKQFKKEELTYDETDVGDILKVWWKENQIYKIMEKDKCSFGQIIRIIYLKEGNPIKMLQIEEDFKQAGKVCEDVVYVFKWIDYTCKLEYKISTRKTCNREVLKDSDYIDRIKDILFTAKWEMEIH